VLSNYCLTPSTAALTLYRRYLTIGYLSGSARLLMTESLPLLLIFQSALYGLYLFTLTCTQRKTVDHSNLEICVGITNYLRSKIEWYAQMSEPLQKRKVGILHFLVIILRKFSKVIRKTLRHTRNRCSKDKHLR
jgi:hypothetical protein